MSDYLEQYANPRVVEKIFREAYTGVPSLYSNAPDELKTQAQSISEMLVRAERFAVEYMGYPHVQPEGSFESTYNDVCLIITKIQDEDTIQYCKSVAKEHSRPLPTATPTDLCSDKQYNYLRVLGYEGPQPSKSEAPRLIERLKRAKEKLGSR